jgi:hypothetical protein
MPAGDEASEIQLIGGPDDGRDFGVLMGERALRYTRDDASLEADARATPMVAALLAGYGEEAGPGPFVIPATLDYRNAAIVRRVAAPAVDEAGS